MSVSYLLVGCCSPRRAAHDGPANGPDTTHTACGMILLKHVKPEGASQSRSSGERPWHVRFYHLRMNCARLRLSAETTTIFVRDGWLIIEVAEADALQQQLADAHGERLLTVAEISQRTGFTAGAVRDWIKRSMLAAVRVGKEYRVREADLAKLLDGKSRQTVSISKRIARRRKAVSA